MKSVSKSRNKIENITCKQIWSFKIDRVIPFDSKQLNNMEQQMFYKADINALNYCQNSDPIPLFLIIFMESVIVHLYVAILPNNYHCTKHIAKISVRNTKIISCTIISYEERRKNVR